MRSVPRPYTTVPSTRHPRAEEGNEVPELRHSPRVAAGPLRYPATSCPGSLPVNPRGTEDRVRGSKASVPWVLLSKSLY